MKTRFLIISAIYFFIAMACRSKDSNQEKSKDSLIVYSAQENKEPDIMNENISNEEVEEKLFDELLIKGKDIWVRDIPSTGKVLMKLNEGDKCKILKKGKLAVIKGLPDYWYQVEFDQKTGWIFGSQTNLALFQATDKPITGNLVNCDDEIVNSAETPSSYSYSFKPDKTFQFSVAAGYLIRGKLEWVSNVVTLKPERLIMDTPDGSSESDLKGSISFAVYFHKQLICLVEKENRMIDKNYVPSGGCFCLSD
jgi:hypothetical protein